MAIPADATTCIRFRLGDDDFGLPLSRITEILPAGRITPVPLAPAQIKGLATLRGKVVTLIDPELMFNRSLPPPHLPEDRVAIVLAPPFEHLGLYAHSPLEICETSPGAGGSLPEHPHPADTGGPPGGVHGVGTPVATAGGVLYLLSPDRLVQRCEAFVLDQFRRAVQA